MKEGEGEREREEGLAMFDGEIAKAARHAAQRPMEGGCAFA